MVWEWERWELSRLRYTTVSVPILTLGTCNGPERNVAMNLPVVLAGGRAVTIGKAVGSGRGPEVYIKFIVVPFELELWFEIEV